MREISEHLYFVTMGIGLLSLFLLANAVIVLLSVKAGRWVALRIQRACRKPAEQILKPSKTLKKLDRHFTPAWQVTTKTTEPQLVAKKAKGGKA